LKKEKSQMKRVLSIFLQFLLFLIVFLVGSLLPGANLLPTLSVSAGAGRIFVYDGVLLMLGIYALILLVAAARKRIHIAWPNSTIALFLALLIGLLMKFGFRSI
jgi:threonine/homoserine/homoserine lactone efflux protein